MTSIAAFEARVREILDNFDDWGYQYRMSDYAGSDETERKYEREGLELIAGLEADITQAARKLVVGELESLRDTKAAPMGPGKAQVVPVDYIHARIETLTKGRNDE